MSIEKDVGELTGQVKILIKTIEGLDARNSNEHTTMFDYINKLQDKVGSIEIKEAGIEVYCSGLDKNLTLIISDIKELKIDIGKDISELREAMFIQLRQRLFEKFNQLFKESLIPFIKTKAGFVIAIAITVMVLYAIFGYIVGYEKILSLVSLLLKRN